MKTRKYKIVIAFGARGDWNTSMATVNTAAGPNPIKEGFFTAARAALMNAVKACPLCSASNAPMEEKGVMILNVHLGQLQKHIVVLVMSGLEMNIIPGRICISSQENQSEVSYDYANRVGSCRNHRYDLGESNHNYR